MPARTTSPSPRRTLSGLGAAAALVLAVALGLGALSPVAFAEETPAATETPSAESTPAEQSAPAPEEPAPEEPAEEPAAAPEFTLQPVDAEAEEGGRAEFTVAFEHATAVRWQETTEVYATDPNAADAWADLDAAANPSAATATLVIEDIAAEQDGRRYRAVVTGEDDTELASESAALTVPQPLAAGRGMSALSEETLPAIPLLRAPSFGDGVLSGIDLATTRFHGEDLAVSYFGIDWGAVDTSGGQPWVFAYLEGHESTGVWNQYPSGSGVVDLLLRGVGADATGPGTETLIVELAMPSDGGATSARGPALNRTEYTLLTEAQGTPYTVTVSDTTATVGGRVEITGVASGDHPRRVWGLYYQLPGTTQWYGAEQAQLDNRNIYEAGTVLAIVQKLTLQPVTASMSGLRIRAAARDYFGPTPSEDAQYWDLLYFAYEYDGSGTPVGYGDATLTVADAGGVTLSPPDAGYPVVTAQPQSLVLTPGGGGSVCPTFTASAEGNPYPRLVWEKKIPGDTWVPTAPRGLYYSYSNTQSVCINNSDSGTQVRAKFTNSYGTVYSSAVTVTIRNALPAGSYWGALDGDPGVQFTVPTAVTSGETMTVSGTGWKTETGGLGSIVGVRLSDGDDGWLTTDAEVHHPVTGAVEADKTIWGFARATKFGDFTAEVPVPDDWQVGESYRVQFVTGDWIDGDRARTETTPRDVVVYGEATPPVLITGLQDITATGLTGPWSGAMSVSVQSDTPVTYKWYVRTSNGTAWNPVTGSTSTYTPSVTARPQTVMHVKVVVSNDAGEVSSEATATRVMGTTMTGTPTVTWSDPNPDVGSTVTLHGEGFPANKTGGSAMYLRLDDAQVIPLATSGGTAIRVPTDANGEFDVQVVLPKLTLDSDGNYVPRQAGTERYAVGLLNNFTNSVYTTITTREPDASGGGVEAPEITSGLPSVITIPSSGALSAEVEIAGDPADTYLAWGLTRAGYPAGNVGWTTKSGGYGQLTFSQSLNVSQYNGGWLQVVAINEAGKSATYTARIWVDPGDGTPAWPWVKVESTTEGGQTATAYIEKNVDPGGTAQIVGTGWVTADGEAGSLIAVKLSYESLYGDVGRYSHTGADIIEHPSAPGDTTIWALIQADADGSFSASIQLPDSPDLVAGQKLTVLLSSGVFATGDTPRSVSSEPLVVGGVAWPDEDAGGQIQCVPPEDGLSVTVAPTAELGGTLHIVGKGWCHPTDGGSTVAIKIDDGAISRAADGPDSNATVWAIVEADPLTGDWETDIDVPDGTTTGAHGSVPALSEGEHWLRFLTGSLKAGDRIRTIGTPMGYDTSFVVGEYAPNGTPDPLEYTEDLADSAKGGVTVAKTDTAVVATIPGAAEGDWVYLSAYVEDGSPRLPWGGTWFQADAAGKVTAPLSGVTLPAGTLKIVAQDGNQGHRGELLGWDWLTVGDLAPTTAPAAVDYWTGLGDAVRGTVSVFKAPYDLFVDIPSVAGEWVFLSVYAENGVRQLPWGNTWFRADANGRVSASLWSVLLPTGTIKVVAQSGKSGQVGQLIGWSWLTVVDATATTTVSATAPTVVPAAPFDDDSGLTPENAGNVTGVQDGTVVSLTLSAAKPGDWVYLYAFSKPIPVGWIQVDANRQVRVDVDGLPPGDHKIAVLDQGGKLIGWAGITIEGETSAGTATGAGTGGDGSTETLALAEPQQAVPIAARSGGLGAADWWLLGGGAAILAALVGTVVLVQRRRGLAAGRSAS